MQPLKNEGDMYIMIWMDIHNNLLGKKAKDDIYIFYFIYLGIFPLSVYNFL